MWNRQGRCKPVALAILALLAVLVGLAQYSAALAAVNSNHPDQVATPTPISSPNPVATPSPTQQSSSGQVFISCLYHGPYDREFDLVLEQGHGGAPTVDVTLSLVSGGTQSDQFIAYSKNYRGPYLSISANASWPDRATGYASATCGYAIPTDTPLPTDTPNYALTPTPTATATATHLPRPPAPSPTPGSIASPTAPLPASPTLPSLPPTTTPMVTVPSPTPSLPLPPAILPPAPTPGRVSPPQNTASPSVTPSSVTSGGGGSIPGLPRTGQPEDAMPWLLGMVGALVLVGYWLRRRNRQLS